MAAAQSTSARRSWQFLGPWIGVTVAGYTLGGSDLHYQGGNYAPFNASDFLPGASLTGFVFGAVTGLIIALLQWLVLRKAAPKTKWWIPLNIVGFGLVHALNDSFPYRFLSMPVLLLIGGLIVGAVQFIAFRHALSRPGWWIPIAAAIWLLSFEAGFAMVSLTYGSPILELLLGGGVKGGLTGVLTGIALSSMLVQTSPTHGSFSRGAGRGRQALIAVVIVLGVIGALWLIGKMIGLI